MIEWLARNDASVVAFACEFRCVKNGCCPINCDFSSLTFLFFNIHLLAIINADTVNLENA